MDAFEEITIGALLHDIGKVKQRAAQNPRAKRHQEWGAEWLEQNNLRQFKDFSLYHHRLRDDDPKRDLLSIDRGNQNYRGDLWLIALADNLSASERIDFAKREEWDQQVPLTSIFSTLSLPTTEPDLGTKKDRDSDLKSEQRTIYAFPIVPIDRYPFPQPYLPSSQRDEFVSRRAYEDILDQIESEIKDAFSKGQINSDALIAILERALTFVPSETSIDPMDPAKNPDVSLFDHLKTTAAIAGALWRYFEETKGIKTTEGLDPRTITNMGKDEKPFLLVVGDMSGIQQFIYNIPQERALRGLRGRSFFVEFLSERIATRIIEQLKLSRASIIYRGGGNFRLLCQNSKNAAQAIERLRDEINAWLLKKTGGILSCSIAWVELDKDALAIQEAEPSAAKRQEAQREDIGAYLESQIRQLKYQKFASSITEKFFEPENMSRCCSICTSGEVLEEMPEDHPELLCKSCYSLYKLGADLPHSNYIYKVSGKGDFEVCGEFFALAEAPPRNSSEVCYVIDDYPNWKNIPRGLRALPLFVGSYMPKPHTLERERTMDMPGKGSEEEPLWTLDQMADASIGKPLLGTLRMDVDRLGELFHFGMRRKSLSREATFSRLLEIFFKRYVPRIASGQLTGETFKRPLAVNPTYPRANKPHNAVVVYAGGDDLFITGAWSDVVELAYQVRQAFKQFTQNPHVTISGCLTINKPKEPIRRIAEVAKEGLDLAKAHERKEENSKKSKNAFALFYAPTWKPESSAIIFPSKYEAPVLDWDTFELVINTTFSTILELGVFRDGRFMSSISRGLIIKLISMARQLRSMGQTYPHRLVYALARGLGKEASNDAKESKEERLELMADLQDLERLRQMEVFLVWLDLLLRRA